MTALYGGKGSNQATSDLYVVDSTDPTTPSSIGPSGVGLTGLAIDPTSSILYGVTNTNSGVTPNCLVSLDPGTGAATLIGALGTRITDISFRSDGVLFGISGNSTNLFTIDTATGVATSVGPMGIGTPFGGGLAFDASDVLWASSDGDDGNIYTLDQSTGAATSAGLLTGSPVGAGSVPAMTVDLADGTCYALDFLSGANVHLVTIDLATFVITDVGSMPDRFDALSVGATATEITLTPASGLAGSGVSVDGSGFTPSSPLTATFNGAALTLGGTTSTDGSGAFAGATFTVPAIAPGTYVVRFDDGTAHGSGPYTVNPTPPTNDNCADALALTGVSACVTTQNVDVTSSGPDPLQDLLGTDGGHALWFKWTAPPLGPNGLDVTFTLSPVSPAIGNVNAAILRGACGGQTIPMGTAPSSITLAPNTSPFTGRTAGTVQTLSGVGAASPTGVGSYVQNAPLPVTLTANVASGETVYLEVDNYDGSVQGGYEVCVRLATNAVLVFRNYWDAGGTSIILGPPRDPPPLPPPPPPPPAPGPVGPSGTPMPIGDLSGWRQIFTDDFNTDVPDGQNVATAGSATYFPGAVHTNWTAYPWPWAGTPTWANYFPERTVSVHDSLMDIYLHDEIISGVRKYLIAAVSPNIGYLSPGGKIDVMLRTDNFGNYHISNLLWPQADDNHSKPWPASGEIDFPEANFNSNVFAFMHRENGVDGGDQDVISTGVPIAGAWHKYGIEWHGGTSLKVFIDDVQYGGTLTSRVPLAPMRYVVQNGGQFGITPTPGASGHLYYDWVVVYAPA